MFFDALHLRENSDVSSLHLLFQICFFFGCHWRKLFLETPVSVDLVLLVIIEIDERGCIDNFSELK